MDEFTPVASTVGGMIIGLSVALLMAAGGRIAGISGILGGAVRGAPGDRGWRLYFILGLVAGGVAFAWGAPEVFGEPRVVPWWRLAVAGLLVGFGTRLGSGCTSGHGICGISRFSPRSIVATAVFVGVGMLTVAVVGTVGG